MFAPFCRIVGQSDLSFGFPECPLIRQRDTFNGTIDCSWLGPGPTLPGLWWCHCHKVNGTCSQQEQWRRNTQVCTKWVMKTCLSTFFFTPYQTEISSSPFIRRDEIFVNTFRAFLMKDTNMWPWRESNKNYSLRYKWAHYKQWKEL